MSTPKFTFPGRAPYRLMRSLSLLACLTLLLVSCKKGDDGPAGATGPAGPTGAQGPIGTANVQYSAWFTPASYVKDTVFDLYGFYYIKTDPAITQPIIDSGSVLTYAKLDGYTASIWPTTQVSLMPVVVSYKFSTGGITYNDTWSSLITPGQLKIQFVDDENYYGSIANAHSFRYIIVPGGTPVGSGHVVIKTGSTETNAVGAKSSGDIDLSTKSYEEVCALLHIPE